MKIVEFTAKTGSEQGGTLKTANGLVEVYADLTEVREKITQEHLELLNSILVIRAQDEVRNGIVRGLVEFNGYTDEYFMSTELRKS